MRKLSWMLVVVCLMSLPLLGQSRRRGYTPAGGWHRKATPPIPGTSQPRDGKKRNDKRAAPVPQPTR